MEASGNSTYPTVVPFAYGTDCTNVTAMNGNCSDPMNMPHRTRVALLKQSTPMIIALCVAYGTVFVLAVINNSLVITVIYKNPQMRNVTNYFIANLAAADLTVSLVVLPLTLLSNLFAEWFFGLFLCKAVPYLQSVAVSASVNTLATVAIERYLVIFYPKQNIITQKTAFIIIAILWFVPMVIMIPWLLTQTLRTFSDRHSSMIVCLPVWDPKRPELRKGFFLGAVFLTCYLIPLLVIIVFYSLIGLKVWKRNVSGIRGSQAEKNIQRHKIRIVRMLLVVAVLFALSWIPLYIIRLRTIFGPPLGIQTKRFMRNYINPVAQWMGSANSCVNPFIYCTFSEQFRKYIKELLHGIICFKPQALGCVSNRRPKGVTML